MTASPIETEFGVPIPGEILPVDQWTKTALKKWPPKGPIDFTALFGRPAPIVLDIGCGNGRFTLSSAIARPQFDHLATDILPVVIRYATRRGNQRGLTNVRFAVIGGRELLRDYIAPRSIREIHIYHPQPYYERRQHRLRLVTPEFLALAYRSLTPDGLLVLQTDHPAYARYLRQTVPAFFEMRDHPEPWADAPHGRTRREILAMRAGLPIFRVTGIPRPDLQTTDLEAVAATLPRPNFNADRRLSHWDQLERENR